MGVMVSKFSAWFKLPSVQVLLGVTLYIMGAPYFSCAVHQGLYALSLTIKQALIWIMPFMVGVFVAHTVKGFNKKAPLFILSIMVFEFCSNLLSVWYAYGGGAFASMWVSSIPTSVRQGALQPLWQVSFSPPAWWSAQSGVVVGLVAGLITAFANINYLSTFINAGRYTVETILTKGFARLIPLFVLGFVANIHQTNMFTQMLTHYSALIIVLLGLLMLYILTVFYIGAGGRFSLMRKNIKHLLPAGGLALTTGCSLSTMPWTIEGTGKTLKNPELAKAIIPTTTNIQQVGDCIANAFLCVLLYQQFYGTMPGFSMWLQFSVVFVLARYATAAVLGGAIFIMLPIYEQYLHFTPEMIAIILAFNVLLDPLITSSNVVANGALARLFEEVWLRIQRVMPHQTPKENHTVRSRNASCVKVK